jgi:hypothetical protein
MLCVEYDDDSAALQCEPLASVGLTPSDPPPGKDSPQGPPTRQSGKVRANRRFEAFRDVREVLTRGQDDA